MRLLGLEKKDAKLEKHELEIDVEKGKLDVDLEKVED